MVLGTGDGGGGRAEKGAGTRLILMSSRWSEATSLRRSLFVSCGQLCPGYLRQKNPKKEGKQAYFIKMRRLTFSDDLSPCVSLHRRWPTLKHNQPNQPGADFDQPGAYRRPYS